MYKTIEEIRKLKEEKEVILREVYYGDDVNAVFERQRKLGSMVISINSDVANVVIPALEEDNARSIVWPNISLRLDKLSFISVPSVYEIRNKYKKSLEGCGIDIEGEAPRTREKIEIKKIPLKGFLATIAAQGIAVPLILHAVGGSKTALVKILCGANTGAIVIEVIRYFDFLKPKNKKYSTGRQKTQEDEDINYKPMYEEAIKEVFRDNSQRLDDWFKQLEKVAAEEIDKDLGRMGE